jgi:hypothetical protein
VNETVEAKTFTKLQSESWLLKYVDDAKESVSLAFVN